VIGGPGAFVIAAASFTTFADAILKKLIIEISDDGSVRPVAGTSSSPDNSRRD
jgi:hypothetical protein